MIAHLWLDQDPHGLGGTSIFPDKLTNRTKTETEKYCPHTAVLIKWTILQYFIYLIKKKKRLKNL